MLTVLHTCRHTNWAERVGEMMDAEFANGVNRPCMPTTATNGVVEF